MHRCSPVLPIILSNILILVSLLIITIIIVAPSPSAGYSSSLDQWATKSRINLVDIGSRFQPLSFHEAYSVIWGDLAISDDGQAVQLKLDQHSGSGFVSQDNYLYGYYSASIKLPADYTAGIVLAFYTSNGVEYPKTHDELDFEFLGNIKGKPWRMQTNIYGNGSLSRGREERFNFWFDPTADFHNYSILWNEKHLVFMVDNVPIRHMKKTEELGGDYPSKPMALYATMWDGSSWATNGGKYPVDYKYAPFFTSFKNLRMEGCASNPNSKEEYDDRLDYAHGIDSCTDEEINPVQASELFSLTPHQEAALKWVRKHYLYYSYCDDKARYPIPLPECKDSLGQSRPLVTKHGRPHGKRESRTRT